MTSREKFIFDLTNMQDNILCKENNQVKEDLNITYQTKTKSRSKVRPKFFDFSSESDDGMENKVYCRYPKSPLKEQNIQPCKSFFSKEMCTQALHEHRSRNESLEISSSVTAAKPQAIGSTLEWDDLFDTPHYLKDQTASGKKKLLSSKNVDALFHSTPKELKDRSKQITLYKKLSQSLKFSETENLHFISDRDNLISLDKHSMVSNQDDFVEVQDSSAQTSFQLEGSHDMLLQCPADEEDVSSESQDVSLDTNTRQKGVNKQKQRKKNSISCHENFSPSLEPEESISKGSIGKRCSESKSSQSSYHIDANSLAMKSDGSNQSHQSFVDVQDASVQVELMHSKEQDEASVVPNDTGVTSFSGSMLANAGFKETNDPDFKSLSSKLQKSEEHNSQGSNRSKNGEDSNNSTSSNSMLYVSALEAVSDEQKFSAGSQISSSRAFYSKGQSHFMNANCSIFVANTDSESDTEGACDQPSVKVEASFSDSSVWGEHPDLTEERAEILTRKEDEFANENVFFGAKGSEEIDESMNIEHVTRNNFSENDLVKTMSKNNCREGNENGAAGDDKPCSVSELSNMLKSTTISRRSKYSDSSDEDDAFEKFLAKIKAPNQTDEEAKLERSMSDFVAADDEDLTDESSSESSFSEDEMFHVKVDNILDRKLRSRRKSSSFLEESESGESDKDVKSKPVLQLSSDDEDLLDDFTKEVDMPEVLPKKTSSVSSWHDEMLHTPQTQSNAKIDPNDDRDMSDFKTPFKTPRRPVKLPNAWERPFETPTADYRRKQSTEPSEFKDKRSCPMTVSRLHHLNRRSNIGLDDEAIFLKSLSEDYQDYKRHPEALSYVKHFKDKKTELTKRLFLIYNKHIFKEQLPADLEIEWSTLYRKTAGTFCYRRTSEEAKITLSVKVCDRAERVRDTLAHELCHAAVRLINGVKESHGPVWRSWAQKVNRAFPFMPVIARCHDYIIATKYTYQCTKCNYRIGRHSKSLDIDKKVCGHCLGRFEIFLTRDLNNSEGGKTPATPCTPRTPNKFALFVKESYAEVKKKDSNLKHADVMKILSQQFSEKTKISD